MTEFSTEETVGDLDSGVGTVVLAGFTPDSTTAAGCSEESELHVVESIGHDGTGTVSQAALEVHGGRNSGEGLSRSYGGRQKRKIGQEEAGRG